MSMNFSEFKKFLGADPLNSDPETLRARASGPEFEQAAIDAADFEQKLRSALGVAAPGEEFLEQIMSVSRRPSPRPRWFAIAASVLILIGVSGVTWWQVNLPRTIEEYVAVHYEYDGMELTGKASTDFDVSTISAVLAKLDMGTEKELSDRILFIKLCPTLNGRGAHMIVQSARGVVNIIYMPGTMVEDQRTIEFGDMEAYMVAFEGGTAAIIGRADQDVSSMDQLVRNSLSRTI